MSPSFCSRAEIRAACSATVCRNESTILSYSSSDPRGSTGSDMAVCAGLIRGDMTGSPHQDEDVRAPWVPHPDEPCVTNPVSVVEVVRRLPRDVVEGSWPLASRETMSAGFERMACWRSQSSWAPSRWICSSLAASMWEPIFSRVHCSHVNKLT